MSNNNALFNALDTQKAFGETINSAVKSIRDNFEDTSLAKWTNAIHLVWITNIKLEELKSGLKTVGRFSDQDITKAADVYFLEILVSIDTVSILNNNYASSSPAFVDAYVVFTSNHKAVTSGQGTNELDAEGLQPNESIHWRSVSSSNPNDTIELIKFHPSPVNPDVDFSLMISAPKNVNGHANEYFTYVKSNPKLGLKYAYSFDFTINGGTQQYTFDPWLAD